MKLEQQVVSLELAKKLKELGVEQESLFVWGTISGSVEGGVRSPITGTYEIYLTNTFNLTHSAINVRENNLPLYSAFTVAELGEMLPILVNNTSITIHKNEKIWEIMYGYRQLRLYSEKEADARAKILIYLLENNLIK